MQKVLGSSYGLGASIVASYGLLQERMEGRVAGWKFKLLSAGGKEVILKSVAQALCYELVQASSKGLSETYVNYVEFLVFWGRRRKRYSLMFKRENYEKEGTRGFGF